MARIFRTTVSVRWRYGESEVETTIVRWDLNDNHSVHFGSHLFDSVTSVASVVNPDFWCDK